MVADDVEKVLLDAGGQAQRSRPHVAGSPLGDGLHDLLELLDSVRESGQHRGDEHRPRRHFGIGVEQDFVEDSVGWRRDLLGDLVGLELDQRIILGHALARLLQPAANDRLGAFLLERNEDLDHGNL